MHILLVEDHDDSAEALLRLLAREGYVVTRAATLAAARAHAAAGGFDLLICDLQLPDGMGWSLLTELRKSQQIPAIALTACTLPDHREQCRRAGFYAHLPKPCDLSLLLSAIRDGPTGGMRGFEQSQAAFNSPAPPPGLRP